MFGCYGRGVFDCAEQFFQTAEAREQQWAMSGSAFGGDGPGEVVDLFFESLDILLKTSSVDDLPGEYLQHGQVDDAGKKECGVHDL